MGWKIATIVFVLALLATALAISYARNVSRKSSEVLVLDLNVDSERGSVLFENVGTLDLGSQAYVKFEAEVVSVNGLDKIVLDGKAILNSAKSKYEVIMPCIYSLNMECYRILMVIPGWDHPLKIEPGKYSLSIKLSWNNAEGKGKIKLKIKPETTYASVRIIGAKPENTSGWSIAEGSTRSYSMLTSKPKTLGDKCVFNVWIWFFNRNVKETFLEVEGAGGKQYIAEHIKLLENGMYREVLLEISVPKENTYTVKTRTGEIVLQQTIKC